MIGRFLEISVCTPNIQESLEFYQRLGFAQAETGDVWSHRYAVITDGRLFLGLHEYEFASPSLTFVRPELAAHLEALRAHGVHFEFEKTADEQFNEAGFLDPDGQMVTLLEARTFSPLPLTAAEESRCGHFSEYTIPSRNIETAIVFWEPLGFVTTHRGDQPFPSATLTSELINLGFCRSPGFRAPALTFVEPDMAVRIARLESAGLEVNRDVPGREAADENAVLRSPEGLVLQLLTGDH
ncbi:MAG: VOC family protein [Proteobacteria bacterium]|nr:VOC family protein [Pseudomonadota bacterium]